MGDFDYNGFVDDDDVTLLGVYYNPGRYSHPLARRGRRPGTGEPDPACALRASASSPRHDAATGKTAGQLPFYPSAAVAILPPLFG